MRGRRQEPSSLKLVKGTFRQDRHHVDTPTPEPGLPDPPASLNARQREIFLEIAGLMEKMKLASPSFVHKLELAAKAKFEIEEADRAIEADGGPVYRVKSLLKKHPSVDIRHKAMQLLHRCLDDLGLSPSTIGRTRTTGKSKQASLFEDFGA